MTPGILGVSIRACLSTGRSHSVRAVNLAEGTESVSVTGDVAISLHLRRFTSGSEFHLPLQEGKTQSLISHMSSLSHDCGKQ